MSEAPIVYDLQSFQRINSLQAEVEELRKAIEGGGDKGGSGKVSDDLTDYKVAASEARSETKLARLEGKIDVLATSINNLGTKIDGQRAEASSNRNVLVSVIIGSALAVITLIVAMFSYGASTFYNGTVVRDVVQREISATKSVANTPSTDSKPAH